MFTEESLYQNLAGPSTHFTLIKIYEESPHSSHNYYGPETWLVNQGLPGSEWVVGKDLDRDS